MKENVLYSDLRAEAFEILSSGVIPKTLIIAEGSAYCKDFYDTLFNHIIPTIDKLLLVEGRTLYQTRIMINNKDRLSQFLFAFKNKDNWDIDVKKWNNKNLSFCSYKLSE